MTGAQFDHLLGSTAPIRVSFEFFPPKTEKMEETLWSCIERLAPLRPSFVSVTYGAGGSTRERTHATVARIIRETDLAPAAHLTCVDATREEVDQVVRSYKAAGVRHIVALRGDPADGMGRKYQPHPGGYASTPDLIRGIRAIGDFEISVSAYPEKHPESPDLPADIQLLKRKVEAGATRAITQFFFDNDIFERYVDRVRAAGIDIPIVPGIIPVLDFERTAGFARRAGASVPAWLAHRFEGLERDDKTRQLVAATVAAEQCFDLVKRGYRDFHFYTMNRADLVYAIGHLLGLRPAPDAKAAAAASPVGAAA
ncbi:methylenetetrahydrofolate reductase [NAD(P)H] [Prosthecomicrobium hirschii]|uniref:Methylenetetrahydrofolate reductase n=1 Tax=Prosthecodimorpha hirschii TaxID=665126 RepID=A0A0P6W0R4_9HYPH|nr:methylenetetrahydrofolate reductase [NAD(P)H] [Prosthecomicrobium hirschii]KPL51688.1 5,10-methylenetetrahydrofolate reductase [Prosthecomicrobium hirschii]MCW1844016.1 methylenetetrahydrofolate reductase [NAD(P)H] [Prosthecomicrobium hirschii]TPQ49213.1 methylenetetrahydrofolate reductase [NAD(P)H] [Prosthecomicrobium hirschii]